MNDADLRILLDLVGLLHESSPHSFIERPAIVQKLTSLLHADGIGHTKWSNHGRRLEQTVGWGRGGCMARDYKAYFGTVDPITPLLRGNSGPIVIETLIDRKAQRRIEYFTDFLWPYKAYPGIKISLPDAGGTLFDYCFVTSDPRKRFGKREVSLLNMLRPHLINMQRLQLAESSHGEPDGSMNNYPGFTLEASKSPRPNRKARTLLAGLEPLEKDVLYGLLTQLSHDSLVALQWNGYNLCMAHVRSEDDGALIRVVYLLAHTVGSGAWLQQRFALTLREGEICHLLLKGMADKEIAARLNMSFWTVRRHVGRVLEKLGIESRSAIGFAVLNASHRGDTG